MPGMIAALATMVIAVAPIEKPAIAGMSGGAVSQADAGPNTDILAWQAGPTRCSGRLVEPVAVADTLRRIWPNSLMEKVEPQSFRFVIDAAGTPRSIIFLAQSKPLETLERPRPGQRQAGQPATNSAALTALYLENFGILSKPFAIATSAALAGATYPAGKSMDDCTISFRPVRIPFVKAGPLDAGATYEFRRTNFQRQEFEKFDPAGSSCRKSPPIPLAVSLPNRKKLPVFPGRSSWSVISFGVDQAGVPTSVTVTGSSGNAELDAAFVSSVLASRFEERTESVQGCEVSYALPGALVAAVKQPELDTLARRDATCPKRLAWEKLTKIPIPAEYSSRGIEGWAILGFDLKPDGKTHNVKVLAAQPTEAFGAIGKLMIAGAQKKATNESFVGCVQAVRFAL